MAKKTRVRVPQDAPAGAVIAAQAENKLDDFAQDLGRMLGQAQNKAESWLGQRKAIADHLIGLRDTATQLLAQLGVSDAPRRGRRSGKPAAASAGSQRTGSAKGRKKKRTMSPEARAKIGAAQRARWARQKSQK